MIRSIFILLVFALVIATCSFSQEDTTAIQEIEEMSVSFSKEKEIAYSDSEFFIIDFHIDTSGKYLLVRHFRNYFVYTLDENMQVDQRLELKFHPLKLFPDCMGRIHVLSKEVMYCLGTIRGKLKIVDKTSMRDYYSFYKFCKGAVQDYVVMEREIKYDQTSLIYTANNAGRRKNDVYRVQDSTMLRSIHEEMALINGAGQADKIMGDNYLIGGQKSRTYAQLARKYFFEQVISKPLYNPVFVINDTLHVFDHTNGYGLTMNQQGQIFSKMPITYQNDRHWIKEVQLDPISQHFYSMERKNGVVIYALLSDSCKVIHRSRIDKHAYPKKIIVYNGYAYYTYKEYVDDNLNKLFRQHL